MTARLPSVVVEYTTIMALAMLVSAAYGLAAGQDMNWDLRNYHYYGVHVLLTGRLGVDISPANMPGYLNPLIYLPAYFLIEALPPVVAGAILGALSGLCAVAIYALARCVIPDIPGWNGRLIAGAATLCGVTGPMFLSEIGTSFADNFSALLVVLGLLAVIRELPVAPAGGRKGIGHLVAGLLLGAATGLKLTNAVCAIALAVGLAVVWARGGTNARRFAVFALGGLAGAVLTGGPWAYALARDFGSPVFPYYNGVFRSPLFEPVSVSDPTFLPDSLLDALSYPLQWLVGGHPTAEVAFRDARFALVGLGVVAWGLAALVGVARRVVQAGPMSGIGSAAPAGRAGPRVDPHHRLLILVFYGVAFALWLAMFAIQRYVIPLELLSGVLLYVLCERLASSRSATLGAFLVLAAFAVLWTRPGNWDRIPYGDNWFGVAIPAPLAEPDTLFILIGTQPSAYLIPFLPESDRFVRISGFTWLEPAVGLGVPAAAMIANHRGPLRTLSNGRLYPSDYAQLTRFGLAQEPGGCLTFRTRMDTFDSCALVRVGPPR